MFNLRFADSCRNIFHHRHLSASLVLNIIQHQRQIRTKRSASSRQREGNNRKLDVVTAVNALRKRHLLSRRAGSGIVLELSCADLLSVADAVVAALVSGKLDIALCGYSSGAVGEVQHAAEIEGLQVEGLDAAGGVVDSEHGRALHLGHDVGGGIAVGDESQ
jgi:hypothetical protein